MDIAWTLHGCMALVACHVALKHALIHLHACLSLISVPSPHNTKGVTKDLQKGCAWKGGVKLTGLLRKCRPCPVLQVFEMLYSN